MRVETTSRNIYTFSELSDKAKNRAIEKHSEFESEIFDSEYTIDDIKNTAAMFGLRIDKFYYSGFCSQGGGASFSGYYEYKPGAYAKTICDRPNDSDLKSIVKTLQEIQRKHFYKISCSFVQRGHYYHENTIYCQELLIDNNDANFDTDAIESDILESIRSFAQWAYRLLESEYEYRTSRDACQESILANEYEFDASGNMA